MWNRRYLTIFLLCSVGLPLYSQFVNTQICVVDVGYINQVYFKESKAAREYYNYIDSVEEEVHRLNAIIRDLNDELASAVSSGNQRQQASLREQIKQEEANLARYREFHKNNIAEQRAELINLDRYYKTLIDAIRWVREHNGFHITLDVSNTRLGVLDWDPEIDMTDNVLERMLE